MKTSILILLIVLSISFAQTTIEDIEKVDGGIGIHITNKLIQDSGLNNFVQKAFEIIMDLDIPDQHLNKDLLGLVTLNGDVSNIKVKSIG